MLVLNIMLYRIAVHSSDVIVIPELDLNLAYILEKPVCGHAKPLNTGAHHKGSRGTDYLVTCMQVRADEAQVGYPVCSANLFELKQLPKMPLSTLNERYSHCCLIRRDAR